MLHHVHSAAFFGWIGLYVLQTQLASRGKIACHYEIGLLGFALTRSVILLGFWITQRAAENRIASGVVNQYESLITILLISVCRTLGSPHRATLACIALLIPIKLSSVLIARSNCWNYIAPLIIGAP